MTGEGMTGPNAKAALAQLQSAAIVERNSCRYCIGCVLLGLHRLKHDQVFKKIS